jgi:ATP-binding cassette subfamily B protein/ATP-binding cassette subfamily C protein
MKLPFREQFSLLGIYFWPQRRRVALLAALLLATIALQLINPLLVRYVLDTASAGTEIGNLVLAAILFTLFGLLQAGASLALTYVGEDVSWTATNALRSDLAYHCLRLDMSFHNSRTPGELIERVDGDVVELAGFFSQLVLRVLANGLLIAGIIVLLFREDWRMGVAAMLYALLTVAALRSVQQRNVRNWEALREHLAAFNGFLEERLAGREDVLANGGEGYVLRGLALVQHRAYLAGFRARIFGAFVFALTHMLFVFATAIGFGLGIYLYLNSLITIGTVYLIVYYLGVLREPLEQIRDQVHELQQSSASIRRIQQLFALQPDVKLDSEHENAADVSPIVHKTADEPIPALEVRFERVSFRYAQSPPSGVNLDGARAGNETGSEPGATGNGAAPLSVLDNISFTLSPGQVLGLLGRTGSGKTTLTRLLFRLYDPTGGGIYLGGRAIRTLPLSLLRRQVAMVTQEVQLFQATLRENLTLFNPNIADDRVLAVLQEVGLWNWYSTQPDGLDTRMHTGGQNLSAGEAQLLVFVRVFLRNPGLVILDEASSRLDPVTETLLERATGKLLQDRTGIVIAHRLGTVQRADAILILERGRIVEHGSRQELAADPASRFYHLLQTGLEEALA